VTKAAETSSHNDTATWLVLIYRVPSEPTRLRATVWRRLRSLGAVYLQNSVAALPPGPGTERALRRLQHEIVEMSGTAVLVSAEVLTGAQLVMETYQAARSDEYEEILDRCDDFLAGIHKEYDAAHFTFAELEENEVDHTKLVSWLAKVKDRDHFNAPGRDEASAALTACEQALEGYAARVYAEEPEGH